jgi:hypothetical protein
VATSVGQTANVCVREYSGVAQSSAIENVTGGGSTLSSAASPASFTFTPTTANDWGIGGAIGWFGAGAVTGAGGSYAIRGAGQCQTTVTNGFIDSNAAIPSGSTTPTFIWTPSGGILYMIGFGLKHA